MQAGAIELPREQRFEVHERFGARERGEDEAQVGVGLEGVGLGGFDEAVEVGAGVGAADGVGEEPVLAADDEGPDRVLDEIGVERDAAVVEDADELRPLVVEIAERLARERLRRDARQASSSQRRSASTTGRERSARRRVRSSGVASNLRRACAQQPTCTMPGRWPTAV